MNLFPIFVSLFVCIGFSQSMYETVSLGEGFVEDESFRQLHCTEFDLNINTENTANYTKLLQEACRSANREDGKKHGKRSLTAILAGVGIGVGVANLVAIGAMGLYLVHNHARVNNIENATQELYRLIGNVTDLMDGVEKQLSAKDMINLINELFEHNAVDKMLSILGYDSTEHLTRLGFDMRLGTDYTKTLDYTFRCGVNQSHYKIEICGSNNPTRKYGTVKLVSPIGEFGHNGYSYMYYNTPRVAVFTEKGPISANSCQKIGSHFTCSMTTTKCTLRNYTECPLEYNQTPDGIFSMELGDSTVVSTTHHTYNFYPNVSNLQNFTVEDVPRTGSFLLRAPRNSMVQISSKKFFGRHDVLQIKPIVVAEQITHFDRKQLIEYFAQKEKTGEAIDRIAADLAIANTPFDFLLWVKNIWNYVLNFLSCTSPIVTIIVVIIVIYFLKKQCC